MKALPVLVASALALTTLTACESVLLTPRERVQLAVGEQRWAARGFANYSFEMRTGCFCPPEINDWARVEVVAGHVTRVTLLSTNEVITDYRVEWWPTVEEVFAELRGADAADYLATVEFTLDPTLGYPTSASFMAPRNVADGDHTRSLRNAQPLL